MPPEQGNQASQAPRVSGWCDVCFAYDLGLSVDLDAAAALIREESQRRRLPVQRRRAATWLDYEPPPLRVTLHRDAITLAGFPTDTAVECTVFDFGAASVRFRVPFDAPLDALPALADALYEQPELLAESRAIAEQVSQAIATAINKPALAPVVEDYPVFAITGWDQSLTPDRLIADHGQSLARILHAETGELSDQQTVAALAARVSFGPGDAVFASWECAVVLDRDPADVLTVLEHVNVELAEMRLLDATLDAVLDNAYTLMQRQSTQRFWPHGPGAIGLRHLAMAQMDAAMLFESVENAIKLVGDQHLARVYGLAASRVRLAEWDAAILRKLDTAESIYQKLTQIETGKRMEVLEIIIIVLIAVSILMPFIGLGGH